MSENHSKASENHSKKRENHSKIVNFTFLESLLRDSSLVSNCPYVRSQKKWNSLFWGDFHSFGVIITHFGMIFTCFESDFHSVGMIFKIFTLVKSNDFTLFTLREYCFVIRECLGKQFYSQACPTRQSRKEKIVAAFITRLLQMSGWHEAQLFFQEVFLNRHVSVHLRVSQRTKASDWELKPPPLPSVIPLNT